MFSRIRFKNLGLSLCFGILIGLSVLCLSNIAGNWLFLFTIGLFLFGFSLFIRIQQGSWLAPGAFFALYWAVFVILALVVAPDFDVRPEGLLWILFSIFAVYIGSVIGLGKMLFKAIPPSGQTRIKNLSTYRKPNNLNFPWLKQLVILCSILGLGAIIVLVLSTGRDLLSLLSLESISQIGREYTIARYLDPAYKEPGLAVALFTFIYLGALFGGILFAKTSSKRDHIISLLPFIPAIGVMIILTTRTSIYFTILIWVSSYFSTHVLTSKGLPSLFRWKYIIPGLVILILLVGVVTMALMSRYGINIKNINIEVLIKIWSMIRVDVFAPLATFSQWFAQHWQETVEPAFGSFTFAGPLHWLGITEPLGYEPVEVPPTIFDTTLFTLFRNLISDFTLIGSILLLFAGGVLGGIVFRQVVRGEILCLPILAAFYGVILCSFSGSLFDYTTVLIAWIIFVAYFVFIKIGKELKINEDVLK